MSILLKTTIAAAALTGGAYTAHAQETFADNAQPSEIFQRAASGDVPASAPFQYAPKLLAGATIAVARIDGGRLIPTPYGETEDWTFLDRRVSANIVQLGASAYIKYVPELSSGDISPKNTIDEIRLTAANEGFEYILMYGVGMDANWASFGGQTLPETGLSVKPDCQAWEQAKAKALLVNSFTGEVLGAATADSIEYNIGQLADEVEDLIASVSPVIQIADFVVPAAPAKI